MKNRPLFWMCLIMIAVTGVMTCWKDGKWIKDLQPSSVELHFHSGDSVLVTGTVYQTAPGDTYQVLYLKDTIISDTKDKDVKYREEKIIGYVDQDAAIHIGNTVRIKGELNLFQEARNPGNFNQKLYYQKQKIHGMVWGKNLEIIEGNVWFFRDKLCHLRRKWQSGLKEALGDKDGSILSAMLLGEKQGMEAEVKELYQANGIAHILAISSLHLSLVGAGIYQIFRRLSGSYLCGGVVGVLFLSVYILMIGWTVSAVRALVMFLFRVGADITGRKYDAMTALGVAAVIILIWSPLYLLDGGFLLSFGAAGAILFVLPSFTNDQKKYFYYTSLSIQLVLLPIQLYYFYEYPIYSMVLNLYVIPLLTVLLCAGFAGSFLWLFIPRLGNLLFLVCKGILWLYENSCELAGKLPGARIITGQPAMWQVLLYYLLIFLVLLCVRRRKVLMVSLAFLAGFGMLTLHPEDWGRMRIAFLDVGQGDCIYLQSADQMSCLVDGGSSDVKQVGKYRIEPYLKCRGVGKLNYVFVTHGDEDHIGGIRELLERQDVGVEIERIVFPAKEYWDESLYELAELAQEEGTEVWIIQQGKKVEAGGITITCLAPGNGLYLEDGNEASLVLAVQSENFDMLLTGDVEGQGEEGLLQELKEHYQNTSWEILKVAHHGSKNSTSESFLDIVCPKISIISAGIDNRYGHPHQELTERLQEAESQILSTQENGAIEYVLKKSEPR